MTRVRFAARAGALAIAGLFCLAALKPFAAPVAVGPGQAGIASVSVDISPLPPAPPVPPRSLAHGEAVASVATLPVSNSGGGDTLDLWVDQSGRLTFNSAEKFEAYRRCHREAEAAHRDASSCGTTSAQEVTLNRRVTRGWH
jgi:hypothetical protein